jgi:DNA-binding NarL/FixJ family response regulator
MPAHDKTIRPIRILIADDHAIFRDGLRRVLEADPELRVVGEASDGAAAVKLTTELKPDIVLLDLAMPRLPGLDALRELASGPNAPRVILLTAAIERSEIVSALQLGARGVVLKAWASDVLLKGIRGVVRGEYWVGRESVADLVDALRSVGPAAALPDQRQKNFGLTRRELEIVGAVVAGYTNKEIAQKFSLGEDTVKHHITSIFDKTGVSNRLELALFALHHGLLQELPAPRSRPA